MKRKAPSLSIAFLLAAALAACGCAASPAATPTASPSYAVTAVPAATAPPEPGRQEILEAFREIAFTSEYGGSTDEIRKWTQPIRVEVLGNPTEEDRAALGRAMDGLNAVKGFPGIGMAEDGGNMAVWFVKLDEMAGHFANYVQGNWGFFDTNWNETGITYATVAIATDVTDQAGRNHLIFEETLQSMGLMQDSYRYADSIFYGRWTKVQQPARIDWELLRILYMPELRHGMPSAEAMQTLEEYYAGPPLN